MGTPSADTEQDSFTGAPEAADTVPPVEFEGSGLGGSDFQDSSSFTAVSTELPPTVEPLPYDDGSVPAPMPAMDEIPAEGSFPILPTFANQEALRKRDQSEAADKAAVKAAAESHTKTFYSAHQEKLKKKAAANRAEQKVNPEAGVPTKGTAWEKVTGLVNFAVTGVTKDRTRLKEVLTSCKTNGEDLDMDKDAKLKDVLRRCHVAQVAALGFFEGQQLTSRARGSKRVDIENFKDASCYLSVAAMGFFEGQQLTSRARGSKRVDIEYFKDASCYLSVAAMGFFEGQQLTSRARGSKRVDIEYFKDAEADRLKTVESLMPKHRSRPALLQMASVRSRSVPSRQTTKGALRLGGMALGVAAAVSPNRINLAMAGAIQEALAEHFNDQLRNLRGNEEDGNEGYEYGAEQVS
eukprot:gene24433-10032_t